MMIKISDLDPSNTHLKEISKKLNGSNKVMLMTGAGISSNAGIPDFRSPTGVFASIMKQYPHLSIKSGKELFDISLFRDTETISAFASFMNKLYLCIQSAKPTKAHKFIHLLKRKSKLLKCYTQNIDGLERCLGLINSCDNWDKFSIKNGFRKIWKDMDIIQLHGDMNSLTCTKCYKETSWNIDILDQFKEGELPSCPSCIAANEDRIMRGKRSLGLGGVLRPNIVLYGENHPFGDVIAKGLNVDLSSGKPDIFIIMGTSLKVDGVKQLVKQISKKVHSHKGIVIFVNKTPVAESTWSDIIDYHVPFDCDEWIESLKLNCPELFEKLQITKEEDDTKIETTQLHTPPTTPIKKIATKTTRKRTTTHSPLKKSGKVGKKSSQKAFSLSTPSKKEIASPRKNIYHTPSKDTRKATVITPTTLPRKNDSKASKPDKNHTSRKASSPKAFSFTSPEKKRRIIKKVSIKPKITSKIFAKLQLEATKEPTAIDTTI